MRQRPILRKTRLVDLLPPLLVVGLLVYVLLREFYGELPRLQYFTAVPLIALAVAELIAARRVRAAVRHDPRAKPMAALVIARCVALGKASSLVAAGVVGASAGLLSYVLPDAGMTTAAADDARVGTVLIISAVALVAAGLILERAGIDPRHDDKS